MRLPRRPCWPLEARLSMLGDQRSAAARWAANRCTSGGQTSSTSKSRDHEQAPVSWRPGPKDAHPGASPGRTRLPGRSTRSGKSCPRTRTRCRHGGGGPIGYLVTGEGGLKGPVMISTGLPLGSSRSNGLTEASSKSVLPGGQLLMRPAVTLSRVSSFLGVRLRRRVRRSRRAWRRRW